MLGRASASVILSAMTCAFALAFRADMPNAVTDCFPVFRIAGFILGAYRHHPLPLTAIRACFLVMRSPFRFVRCVARQQILSSAASLADSGSPIRG